MTQSGQYWKSHTAGYACLHISRSVNFEPLLAKMDFLFGENGLFANEINL